MSKSLRGGAWFQSLVIKLILIALAVVPAIALYRQRFPSRQAEQTTFAVAEKSKPGPIPRVEPDPTEGAKLVGMQVCAGCHQDQQTALATSGHSRTFAHTSKSEIARSLDGQSFTDSVLNVTYQYHFHPEKGLSVAIPEHFAEDFPLQYALGSGIHGMTFVGISNVKEGAVEPRNIALEHHVTVFPQSKQKLNLTPGHDGREVRRKHSMFGAPMEQGSVQLCFDCHTTNLKINDFALVDLQENVTCEKCHGPGSRHVEAAERGEKSPRHLRLIPNTFTADQQMRACGQCHRYPAPGTAIHRNDLGSLRFQPVGLMQSRCYLESKGKLTCSSCHDPHAGTTHDSATYTAVCLKCHDKVKAESSTCPISPATDCARCHMPAVKVVHDVPFTDHWIRIRNEEDPPAIDPIPLPEKSKK